MDLSEGEQGEGWMVGTCWDFVLEGLRNLLCCESRILQSGPGHSCCISFSYWLPRPEGN